MEYPVLKHYDRLFCGLVAESKAEPLDPEELYDDVITENTQKQRSRTFVLFLFNDGRY